MTADISLDLREEDLRRIAEMTAAVLTPILRAEMRCLLYERQGEARDVDGWYTLAQLATTTGRHGRGERRGILPWSASKIRQMIKSGTLPKPQNDGYRLVWRKRDIHDFLRDHVPSGA